MNTAVMVDKIITNLQIVAEFLLKLLFTVEDVKKCLEIVTLEFDLTLQSSGIWTHDFLTETETADKNENVA